jgi:hypothetical protein
LIEEKGLMADDFERTGNYGDGDEGLATGTRLAASNRG